VCLPPWPLPSLLLLPLGPGRRCRLGHSSPFIVIYNTSHVYFRFMYQMNAQSAPANLTAATPARSRERRQSVQAADTVVAVLKGLASLGGGASLTTLAAHLSENPAKVHRYLVSLIDGGLVTQNANTQQYTLGLEAMLI